MWLADTVRTFEVVPFSAPEPDDPLDHDPVMTDLPDVASIPVFDAFGDETTVAELDSCELQDHDGGWD